MEYILDFKLKPLSSSGLIVWEKMDITKLDSVQKDFVYFVTYGVGIEILKLHVIFISGFGQILHFFAFKDWVPIQLASRQAVRTLEENSLA